ncbi:hypothetical protein CPC16_009321 [Podila verticillata]|nr:hypothetical protein CPC16_009321 [Podila verticillata]
MLQFSKGGHDNTIRLALLVCGTPIPSILEVHGDYPDIFRGLFQAGLDQLKEQGAIDPKTQLVLAGFDVREGIYPRAKEWDGIVISGSASDAYADIPWINDLVKYVHEFPRDRDAPKIIGVCFGHQIIGRAFGAKVAKNTRGWEIGWTPTKLTTEGQTFWQDSIMRIHELHQDIVYDLPKDFNLLASTEHTQVQSMISKDGKIVSLQGHPEFTCPIMKEFITVRTALGVFNQELSSEASKVVENPVDRVKVAARLLEYLKEE